MSMPADTAEATLGEVVVTARRRAESLQEVPQTVNAVSADTLGKLNITQFADVQTVVPGISLTNRADGYSQAASMRGVTYDVNTAAPIGTVALYINDARVQDGRDREGSDAADRGEGKDRGADRDDREDEHSEHRTPIEAEFHEPRRQPDAFKRTGPIGPPCGSPPESPCDTVPNPRRNGSRERRGSTTTGFSCPT